MRYTLEYPSELPTAPDDFLIPDVIRDVVAIAETAGFSAIALSEHPAPSLKWRRNGGHNTLDPVAALSFMAGVTADIKLMTNLFVLPFRNPYLSAIWTDPEMPVSGMGFTAAGPMWLQPPVQRPHPPIWIGGNTAAALRRVVEYGSGWMPLIAPAGMASAIGTAALEDAAAFGTRLARLREALVDAGRDPLSVDVQVICPWIDLDDDSSLRQAQDTLSELAEHGANWAVAHVDEASPAAAGEYIAAFGEAVITGNLVSSPTIKEHRP
ncbi:LLM class flavin-dependent oxidoreductase [Mycolicibacterium sp. P1-5]|uniref:LLM class flavin-dependent oxidoreductase n=1 Tax=Mycolicibacterium sp. P1-5 TaxID=2024617 RepID=UPI0011EE62EE|nr:LLM class flavin-dependent oxidoreductase [Mycolicibacterium sp. P1-5]KAA0109160.1 LLM class flavin-dependent oxidoreductase [Mycolicibacterium sp. P1-5]